MKGGSGDGKEKAGIEGIRSLFRHSLHLVFLESENRIPRLCEGVVHVFEFRIGSFPGSRP